LAAKAKKAGRATSEKIAKVTKRRTYIAGRFTFGKRGFVQLLLARSRTRRLIEIDLPDLEERPARLFQKQDVV
jgi:hypothetical protein